MENNKNLNEDLYRAYLEYEQYKSIINALQNEYTLKKAAAEELKIASEEVKKIPNKDGLIPVGPGFIKGKFEGKVLVPIGMNYYVAYTPEEASEKFSKMAKLAEEDAKQLYSKIQELVKVMAVLEKKILELQQRGSAGAGAAEKGT